MHRFAPSCWAVVAGINISDGLTKMAATRLRGMVSDAV